MTSSEPTRRQRTRKAHYYKLKVAGICVSCKCRPAAGETVRCERCQAQLLAHHKVTNKLPARLAYHKRKQREVTKRRQEAGLCNRCNQPLATLTLCEKHRVEIREARRLQKLAQGAPTRITKCSYCNEPGHRIQTCKVRASGQLEPRYRDELASMRFESIEADIYPAGWNV